MVIGEGAATSDAVIPGDATNGLLVNPSDRAARDMGKIDIAAFDVALPSGTNSIGAVSLNSGGTLAVTITSTGSTVAASQYGTWTSTVTQATGTNLHTVVDSGTINLGSAGTLAVTVTSTGSTVAASQYGTWNISALQSALPAGTNWLGTIALASSTSVSITSTGSTVAASQYGTWTNTVTQATGTNLHTVVDSGTVSISSTGSTVAASQYGNWAVSITSTGSTVAVTDNLGSLTVDAPLASPVFVTTTPSSTGGWTPVIMTGLNVSTQGSIKSSAGTLGGYYIYNPNASVAYCQFFDSAVAITPGTTTPKWTIGVPATSAANLEIANGINFVSGIRVVATTAASNATALTTGLDCSFLFK